MQLSGVIVVIAYMVSVVTTNTGTADKKAAKFNPCYPKNCFDYHTIEAHYPDYEKRLIRPGVWLKVKASRYNTTAGEFQLYDDLDTSRTGLKQSVPALVQIDLGQNHNQKQKAYDDKMKGLEVQIKSAWQKMHQGAAQLLPGNTRTPGDPISPELQSKVSSLTTNFSTARSRLSDEAKVAFHEYASDWMVTVYNYLHPDFQMNREKRTPPKEIPREQTNPDLSYVVPRDFSVYVKGYMGFGLHGALKFAPQLAAQVNRTNYNTIYMANYANNFYEVWLPVLPNIKLFP